MTNFHMMPDPFWITSHGTAMQIERPQDIQLVKRAGWGIKVVGKPGTYNVFHFPIPTPIMTNEGGFKLCVNGVMLQFTTSSDDAIVQSIFINDGAVLLEDYKDVNLSGNVGYKSFYVDSYAPLKLGIDIVIHVKFGTEAQEPTMIFEAAGCSFTFPYSL